MSHFYRELLQQSEKQHEATIAATTSVSTAPSSSSTSKKGPTLPKVVEPPNLRIQRPLKPAALTDAMIAAMAKEEGKEVELNDDNQIVDHRDLLNAGLNLGGVNTRRLGLSRTAGAKTNAEEPVNTHRAAGAAATKAEIRSRQAAMLARQLEEEKERVVREQEQREREERERVVKRKNDETDVMSAKERYLERKRQREAEAKATAEATG